MSDEQDHAKIIANHLSAKSGRHVWPAGAVSNSKLKISEKAHDEKTRDGYWLLRLVTRH